MPLLSLLLLAALQSHPHWQVPHNIAEQQPLATCATMRTYVLSKDPGHHIERVLTCVPLQSQSLKHAGTAHFEPTAQPGAAKPKLLY